MLLFLGKEVMKRWKHLRDAFARDEKYAKESKTSGSLVTKKKKKYIFHDELQFLKKIYQNTETTESFILEEGNKNETNNRPWQQPENLVREEGRTTTTTTKEKALLSQPRRKRKNMDVVDLKNLSVLDKEEPPNPQMSFYNSLLPHTENFNSNEWLQFQIEVLRVISNIKNQNHRNQEYSTQLHQHIQPTHCGQQEQPQTFPQQLQQTFTLIPNHSHPSEFPTFNPPPTPSVSVQNAQPTPTRIPNQNHPAFSIMVSYPPLQSPRRDPPPSLVMTEKIKQTTAAEHFAENGGEEYESSSVSSIK